jgi:ABC-type antimicrobial peptide transport system permease subunit
MFLKNLLRRRTRTFLTVIGIGIGVAAIIALGALANGLEAGYGNMLRGSKADLILSQPNALDISYSQIDEEIGEQLKAAPEVSEVCGMLQGFAQTEDEPIFFVFGHPEDSFVLGRFQIIEGDALYSREAHKSRGKPLLLGSAASEVMDKSVGDTLRMTGSVFRVVGIYQTGDAFEDGGAMLTLKDAQELLGKPRQVSIFYIQLKDLELRERFINRVGRLWPDFSLSGVQDFADNQTMSNMLRSYVWVIGGIAIIIGGVGMMNSQLMSVMERTREIGVLRAVGWSSRRILWMILAEAISVSLLGGLFGLAVGWLIIYMLSNFSILLGIGTNNIESGLLGQAFIVVLVLGIIGGLYPAWRASRMQPIEALRYEGGSGGGKIRRLPIGGMAIQSLWQRSIRTFLTLGAIGLTVGAIMSLQSVVGGMFESMSDMFMKTDAEVMIRQADIADTSLSTIDERIGAKIAAMPEVKSASGIMFTAIMLPDTGGFFILQGYSPHDFAVQHLRIVEGEPLSGNHQAMIGKSIADSMNKGVGNTIELSGVRFRIVGVYESKASWEEMGGVISLRDAQALMGKPRKLTMLFVKMKDPSQAEGLVAKLNQENPEILATMTGDFVEQMPDLKNSYGMLDGISILAILVGGVGVLNTMLMAVFERTREIGVLRALGWRRRAILGMILREAVLLGLIGGVLGIGLAIVLAYSFQLIPSIGSVMQPKWSVDIFARAILVAMTLGMIGGLYPAYRATRLQPVEALRYE